MKKLWENLKDSIMGDCYQGQVQEQEWAMMLGKKFQDLESYIEEQIRDSQPTARFRNSETVQAECRGAREAYTDILQRIRGGEC